MLDNQFEKLAQKIERRIVVESLNALAEMYLEKTAEAIMECDKADRVLFNKISEKHNVVSPIWDNRFGFFGALTNRGIV